MARDLAGRRAAQGLGTSAGGGRDGAGRGAAALPALARLAGAVALAALAARAGHAAAEPGGPAGPAVAGAASEVRAAPLDAAPPAAAPDPTAPATVPATAPGGRAPLGEEITVTANRTPRPLRDSSAAVTVLPRAEIEVSPAVTVDDLLRSVPSFALLRLSSSMVADPSSQAFNLRGIGPSGVSRSLLLVDGIPENDAYGDWVYWRAIPTIDIDRIEVVPGGGSALYGNYALGGVTQIITRPITGRSFDADAEGGSFDTYQLALRGADRWGPVGAELDGELFRSRGYAVVAPYARGPIDGLSPTWDGVLNSRVEVQAAPDLTLTARGGYFYEDENGGTALTTSAVRRLEYGLGARYTPADVGTIELNAYGHAEEFFQDRAAIAPGRVSETLSMVQEVPAHDLGASLVWTAPPLSLGGTHTLMVGTDARRITGATASELFPAAPVRPTATVSRDAAGEQWLYGAFVQDVYDVVEPLSLDLALRYDRWINTDAATTVVSAAGTTTATAYPRRSDDQVSPKAGVRLRALDWLTLRAAAYSAFRAPTLDELYRPFQVGTIFTRSNAALGPETLAGGEAGLEIATPSAISLRATGYWNDLDNPITNVTIGPNLRERQNLGQARIRGVEAEAGWRFAGAFTAIAAYTYVDSVVTAAPGQPQLVGKQLPLDPSQRASASVAYDDQRRLSALVQVRYVGRQYEDDRNTLPMGAFALVDLSVNPRINRNLELVLGVDNLFDRQYLVGRAGVDTIGQPRYVHGGVRVHY